MLLATNLINNGAVAMYGANEAATIGCGNAARDAKTKVYCVGFDNSSFSKKSGFTLEYDKSLPDLSPYILYTEAVAAQRFITKQLKVLPNKVVIPKDIQENENPIWQVYCGDSVLYQVYFSSKTPKIKRIIKLK